MKTLQRDWNDKRIEDTLSMMLRTGVILSAAIVVLGAAAYLVRHGLEPADYRVFKGEPSSLRGVVGVVHGVTLWHSRAMMQLGLLILIATPVARVAFSIYGFARERDRMYTGFTVIVLGILLLSLVGSR